MKVIDVLGTEEDPGLFCKGPWGPALFCPHGKRVKDKEPVELFFEFTEYGACGLGSVLFASGGLKRHGHCLGSSAVPVVKQEVVISLFSNSHGKEQRAS